MKKLNLTQAHKMAKADYELAIKEGVVGTLIYKDFLAAAMKELHANVEVPVVEDKAFEIVNVLGKEMKIYKPLHEIKYEELDDIIEPYCEGLCFDDKYEYFEELEEIVEKAKSLHRRKCYVERKAAEKAAEQKESAPVIPTPVTVPATKPVIVPTTTAPVKYYVCTVDQFICTVNIDEITNKSLVREFPTAAAAIESIIAEGRLLRSIDPTNPRLEGLIKAYAMAKALLNK